MSKQMKMNAQLDQMRRDGMSIDGDNAYKRDLLNAITGALAFGKQRSTPPPVGHWLEPFYEMGKAEADERDAARSLPVGVQDGYALVPVEPTPEIRQAIDLLCDDHRAFDDSEAFWQYLLDSAPAAPTVKESLSVAPTVKAERVPLDPSHRALIKNAIGLLRIRRPAAPDVERVAADLELMLAGHATPADKPSAEWLEVAALAEAPSLPAAGSAGEELEWARHGISEAIELIDCISRHPANRIPVLDQARAVLVKALSAQQSAPVTKELAALAEQVQCCLPTQKERALPAAGSAVEEVEVEVAAWRVSHPDTAWKVYERNPESWAAGDYEIQDLMTVAQHERIVAALSAQIAERDAAIEEWSGTAVQNGMEVDRLNAALSAQQSAPERVSVPVELMELLRNFTFLHDSGVAGVLRGNITALLASHAEGGKV